MRSDAQKYLENLGIGDAWGVHLSEVQGSEERTIRDIVGKLLQFGTLSGPQIGYVRVLLERISERGRVAAPCPTGRVTINGVVLSMKEQENQYAPGTIWKMLVKADQGFKVWATIPAAAVSSTERGSRISFTATLRPSQGDPCFGFGSRPVVHPLGVHV